MRVFTRIDEFLASRTYNSPKPSETPGRPVVDPGTKPGTKPGPAPQKPGPVRRDKPAADPAPKAKAEEVVDRFMRELKKAKAPIKFDISKLKQRYND